MKNPSVGRCISLSIARHGDGDANQCVDSLPAQRSERAMRQPSTEELCHERLGDRFGEELSEYDTRRRVEVLIDQMLGDVPLNGMRTLDVGCGLGFFSERLTQRGAIVTACDIGPGLVQRTRERVGCEAVIADALTLESQFGVNTFDVVVSSECIEHTPDPAVAVKQMATVLKPGGWLALSTPNRVWKPVVALATATRLRPFDGHENFSTWRGLSNVLDSCGIQIVKRSGLHLFPFQFRMHGLSRWCDARLQGLRGVMINICVLGRKRDCGDKANG